MKYDFKKLLPLWETIKEPLRWGVLYLVSMLINQTLLQINLIPENLEIKVWQLLYSFPLRVPFTMVLTISLRFIDKLMHEIGKAVKDKFLMLGLTRF